jgi:sugar O-acyltransferase (sialic acid O-acetyltransferase NeuD family)
MSSARPSMGDQNRFVIWGSAGHAKVIAESIRALGGSIEALFDNATDRSALHGVPAYQGLAGFRRWLTEQSDIHAFYGLVAIGGGRGRDRIEIQKLFLGHGLNVGTVVDPRACVSPSAQLGVGTQVLANAIVAADARVGAACIVNHGASVDHECTVGSGTHLAPRATVCGCVTIGENVFVGAGAIVLPRVRLGDDCVVGAGAVVTRDVPSGTTVVGMPAREINSGS